MAMKDEYDAFIENKTWELVPPPSNVNVIRSLWIFRHKTNLMVPLSDTKLGL
jgi:hypothetical protein